MPFVPIGSKGNALLQMFWFIPEKTVVVDLHMCSLKVQRLQFRGRQFYEVYFPKRVQKQYACKQIMFV